MLRKDREEVLQKINQLEKEGRFFEDVEIDPPSRTLNPEEVDYLKKKLSSKIKTRFTYIIARRFLNKITREKTFVVKDIIGLEHYKNLSSGAIITTNHFNALDSFAVQVAYEAAKHKKRKFYRVIKEGNYTSFPGFFGMLMRHCYTLPLSSHPQTMQNFLNAVDTLLKEGHFVLIYPEQSMWWNYRKPKPFKKTAFKFAAKAFVPVLPCFITMEDTDKVLEDGSYVQAYTIHISAPIYPDENLSVAANTQKMMDENALAWKETYETVYQKELKYN